jgi:hypothetical protein
LPTGTDFLDADFARGDCFLAGAFTGVTCFVATFFATTFGAGGADFFGAGFAAGTTFLTDFAGSFVEALAGTVFVADLLGVDGFVGFDEAVARVEL